MAAKIGPDSGPMGERSAAARSCGSASGLRGWDVRPGQGAMRTGPRLRAVPRAYPEGSFASSATPKCGHPVRHNSAQTVLLRGRRQGAQAHSVRRPRQGRGVRGTE